VKLREEDVQKDEKALLVPVCSRNWTPSSSSTSWLRRTICAWMLCWSLEVW
jgi:hypothetical protein